ncbi:MAG: diphosphomevalonate/mevalonate 3,5-bisphosphate decarboxylase family protein [Marinilabiliaceae bacterium]
MNETRSYFSAWKAPSNLAIVKYWGKKGIQEPVNPSISMSLSESVTTTRVKAVPRERGSVTFRLNNREAPAFLARIEKFIINLQDRLPFLSQYHLEIDSQNTFPHSSGIASSASAMCTLTFCLADLQQQIDPSRSIHIEEVSSIARLGSGSASRSVFGGWNLWGRTTVIPESSDHYAVPLEVAPVFQNYHDDVLIIDSSQKSVSSSHGHALMNHHPYREGRISQALENTTQLLKHLQSGNTEDFTEVAESEALSLHGLMMSSSPGYTLLRPGTLEVIHETRKFREKTGIPVAFSLDAGPNIHLLYPGSFQEEINKWEETTLKQFCENGQIIRDRVGKGPEKIIETTGVGPEEKQI